VNRLALVQRLQTECGVAGTISTTLSQTGSIGRLVTWIDAAWQEIQTRRDDWEFMRSSALNGGGISFATQTDQAVYPLGSGAGTVGVTADNFGKWKRESFRNFTTSVGFTNEIEMADVSYDTWRDDYMLGAMRNVRTRPIAIAIGPDKSLCLGPFPDSIYTVTGDYYTAPTAMAKDTDTPTGLPAQFHSVIVYRAMQMYGGYESAPEVVSRGAEGFASLIRQMEALYLPQMVWGGALA
jgi:hypothetical protein